VAGAGALAVERWPKLSFPYSLQETSTQSLWPSHEDVKDNQVEGISH
jgi:hypothetical protein